MLWAGLGEIRVPETSAYHEHHAAGSCLAEDGESRNLPDTRYNIPIDEQVLRGVDRNSTEEQFWV